MKAHTVGKLESEINECVAERHASVTAGQMPAQIHHSFKQCPMRAMMAEIGVTAQRLLLMARVSDSLAQPRENRQRRTRA